MSRGVCQKFRRGQGEGRRLLAGALDARRQRRKAGAMLVRVAKRCVGFWYRENRPSIVLSRAVATLVVFGSGGGQDGGPTTGAIAGEKLLCLKPSQSSFASTSASSSSFFVRFPKFRNSWRPDVSFRPFRSSAVAEAWQMPAGELRWGADRRNFGASRTILGIRWLHRTLWNYFLKCERQP